MSLRRRLFLAVEKPLSRALVSVSRRLREKTIRNDEGDAFIRRFYLFNVRGWSAVLHYVRRGDSDAEMHNHPSAHCVSVLLVNGYDEERHEDDHECPDVYGGCRATERRRLRAGDVNYIGPRTFHRIDTIHRSSVGSEDSVWTLFLRSPATRPWGFRDGDGRFIPEGHFAAWKRRRGVEIGRDHHKCGQCGRLWHEHPFAQEPMDFARVTCDFRLYRHEMPFEEAARELREWREKMRRQARVGG